MQDGKTLKCMECGKEFEFNMFGIEFDANTPINVCPDCCENRKQIRALFQILQYR